MTISMSLRLEGVLFITLDYSSLQRFWRKFGSGLWLDCSKLLMLLSVNHLLATLAECFGSLSLWKVQSCLMSGVFFLNHKTDWAESATNQYFFPLNCICTSRLTNTKRHSVSICMWKQRVADWCIAWILISANTRQMVLHGEMENVTEGGVVQILPISLCMPERMIQGYPNMLFLWLHLYPK